MRYTIVALGTRGDVQPYVALGLGLKRAGHDVRLVTGDDFETFVKERGLAFTPVGTNAHELLQSEAAHAALESGRNVLVAMWQIVDMFRSALDVMMERLWRASQGTEAIIFSSLGIGAYHIAEKLGVPCFWALTLPIMTRTRAWPSLLVPLRLPLGGGYNLLSHVFVEHFWQQLTGRLFNHWRLEHLDLPRIPLYKWPYPKLAGRPVPCLYHYSPAVLPKPPDWDKHIHVTGYWFLDHPAAWTPPADLVAFLGSGPPPVYVGFGSMNNRDPQATTELVFEALARAGQRGILLTGWGGLGQGDLGDDVFVTEAIPHDWLFPRIAAVVHHGGAGTTGAGLRTGVPSVIIPFAGDQPFWGERVEALGVGPSPIPRRKLSAANLADAIRVATSDEAMRRRAAELGERVRAEDGVARAVEIIERYSATA
jgi:sterol 3beta-glucosyltransferase